ncbi:MAG: cytochrome P450 [Actinomycetota bacterium]
MGGDSAGSARRPAINPKYVFPVLRQLARRDWSSRLLTRAMAPFNPFDPRRYVDPYPVYDEVRRHGSVYHHRRLDGWIITGFTEAEEALRGPVSVDRRELMEELWPYRDVSSGSMDIFNSLLLTLDPPNHTRLRRLVSRTFTPRAVAGMAPAIAEVADGLLDEMAAVGRSGRSVDAMAGFASRLPIYVIGELLGLPREQWPRLKELSDEGAKFVDPITAFQPAEMDAAIAEIVSILDVEIAARRQAPKDDLLSSLVAVEEDGDRLSTVELHSMVILLMVAGHETTTGLLGNSLVHLDRDRRSRDRLATTPELVPNAVEELLRYDSPVQATDRIAVEDMEIGGVPIPAGSGLTILLGAGNRDPQMFERPNELRLDRSDARSLSFGHGIHHCVGAALARLEVEVALPLFLKRFPDHRVVGDELIWKRSITLRGPARLPIELEPVAARLPAH